MITLTLLGAIGRLYPLYITCAQILILAASLLILRKRLSLENLRPGLIDKDSAALEPDYVLFFIIALIGVLAYLGLVISLFLPPLSWGPLNYHLAFPAEWLISGRIEIVPFSFGDHTDTYAPSNVELWYLWLLVPLKSDLLAKVGQFPIYLLGALGVYGICRELGMKRQAGTLGALLFLLTPDIFRQGFTAEVDVAVACFFLLVVYFLLLSLRKEGISHLFLAGLAMGLFLGSKYLSGAYALILTPLFVYALVEKGRASLKKRPEGSASGGLGQSARGALLFILGAFVSGSYWYLRNLILTGSAFYPVSVKVFGITLMPGAYDMETMKADTPFRAGLTASLTNLVAKAFGTPFFFLFLITVLTALVLVLFRPARSGAARSGAQQRGEDKSRLLASYILALPVFLIAIFCWVIPYNVEYRFLFPAVGVGFVGVGYVLDSAGRLKRMLGWEVLLLALWSTFGFPLREGLEVWPGALLPIVPAKHAPLLLLASLLLFAVLFIFPRISWVKRRKGVLLLLPLLVFLVILFHLYYFPELFSRPQETEGKYSRWQNFSFRLFSRLYEQRRSGLAIDFRFINYVGMAEAWDWLLSNTTGNTTIAYTGHNLPYYLYGRRFENKVYYVNINAHPGWLFHQYDLAERKKPDYKPPVDKRPTYNRYDPDYSAWLSNLRARKVEFVFIYRVEWSGREYFAYLDPLHFSIEDLWARTHPESFTRIFANTWVRIYRLSPA
ncbi:MAG: hypothetical protein AMS15_04395 [Planctomycetes bacterium DG_23]|nr:MAG: hypothetical protein AMS15_04395 [Planctomycetes bacterium DG_23]